MKFLTDPVKRFELIETMLFDKDAGGFGCSSGTSGRSRPRPATSPTSR